MLNTQFKSIFSEFSPVKLKHAANAAVTNLFADQTNPRIKPSNTITVNGIRKLLTRLDSPKAPHPDNLQPATKLSGRSGGGREKEGELATTSLKFEYLRRRSRCQMLIGGDYISKLHYIYITLVLSTISTISTYISTLHYISKLHYITLVTLHLTSLPLARVFQCLFTFALASASH